MDAANIEVALKNDQTHQEHIESEEVYATEPRAASVADAAAKSSQALDSQDASAQRSQQEAFDPVPHQEPEEQEIFLSGQEQPGQDATMLSVVVDDDQLRELNGATVESLQQEQVLPQQTESQPAGHPLLQSYQPVYFPGINSLPGEMLQVINAQTSLEQPNLGARAPPFVQSADLYRLVRTFPDFHSKTLHRILAYCQGDLKRAIDHTLFARQFRMIDLGPPYPQTPHHVHHHAQPVHHSPYRIPRGARTHSPLFLYPEDGFGSPAAAPPRRAPVVQPTLQTGVAPQSGATPLASVNTLPSFQSVFVPLYQTNKSQQPHQDTSSHVVVPDILVPDGVSAVHVLKLGQLNSTNDQYVADELESTMPMTSSRHLYQPPETTIRRISEEGVIETIPVKANSLTPHTEMTLSAEKVMNGGEEGDTGGAESSLLVKIPEEDSEERCSIISH